MAQANLKLSLLEPLKIPCPPLSEQHRIAITLSGQFDEIHKACKALEEQLVAINKLPAVLLRQAFNGEL